jgi:hypothetical protein
MMCRHLFWGAILPVKAHSTSSFTKSFARRERFEPWQHEPFINGIC